MQIICGSLTGLSQVNIYGFSESSLLRPRSLELSALARGSVVVLVEASVKAVPPLPIELIPDSGRGRRTHERGFLGRQGVIMILNPLIAGHSRWAMWCNPSHKHCNSNYHEEP